MPPRSDDTLRIGIYYLRPLRSGVFYVWWNDRAHREKGPRRASLGTRDVGEAQQRFAEWVAKNGRFATARAEDVTLAAIFQAYALRHLQGKPSENNARAYLALWLRHFGAAFVSSLNRDSQERFLALLRAQGKGDGYVKRIYGAGTAALRWAFDHELISSLPSFIRRLPDSRPRDRVLDDDEIIRFWRAIDSRYLAAFVVIALNTAARPTAILELRREQFDARFGLLDLQPPGRRETKKRRPTVKVSQTLRPWLEAEGGPWFVAYDGRPLAEIKPAWRRARARAVATLRAEAARAARVAWRAGDAGSAWRIVREARHQAERFKSVTPYALRHTVLSVLNEMGAPPGDIALFAGHAAGARTTWDHYVKGRTKRAEYLKEVVNALDAWMARLGLDSEKPPVAAEGFSARIVSLRTSRVTEARLSGQQTR